MHNGLVQTKLTTKCSLHSKSQGVLFFNWLSARPFEQRGVFVSLCVLWSFWGIWSKLYARCWREDNQLLQCETGIIQSSLQLNNFGTYISVYLPKHNIGPETQNLRILQRATSREIYMSKKKKNNKYYPYSFAQTHYCYSISALHGVDIWNFVRRNFKQASSRIGLIVIPNDNGI